MTLSVTGLTQDSQGRFEVNAGQQVAVTRAITNSADVCIASATPASGASGWLNVFAPAASSVANVQFSGSGEVTLGLRCYNQAGAAPTATQLRFVVAAAVGVNPDLCELPPDPLIRPQGFTRYVLTWNDLFRVGPFPNAPGYLNPVGSYTIGRSFPGASAAAMYITVPIVPEPGKTYVFNHATAQAVAAAGYFEIHRARAATSCRSAPAQAMSGRSPRAPPISCCAYADRRCFTRTCSASPPWLAHQHRPAR